MSIKRLAIACLLFAMPGSSAKAQDEADWKAFGEFTSPDNKSRRHHDEGSICFFDEKNIIHRSNNNLRVWVKCLATRDMVQILHRDVDGKLARRVQQKMSSGYTPPVASMWHDTDPSAIIGMEETANGYAIQPIFRIFYEINCSEQMTLGLELFPGRGAPPSFPPSEWHYVEPETNNWRLLKLVCARDRAS